jgi:hypothetical protein
MQRGWPDELGRISGESFGVSAIGHHPNEQFGHGLMVDKLREGRNTVTSSQFAMFLTANNCRSRVAWVVLCRDRDRSCDSLSIRTGGVTNALLSANCRVLPGIRGGDRLERRS